MVVINAAAAMHGILIFLHLPQVSALHNKTVSPFMAKRWGCILGPILSLQQLPPLSLSLSLYLSLSLSLAILLSFFSLIVDIYTSLFFSLLFLFFFFQTQQFHPSRSQKGTVKPCRYTLMSSCNSSRPFLDLPLVEL